ncbi:MAG TPA: hypothetical protein VES68_02405 [Candidatus Sulfotelmatobacter sp.]|nr:hypothetical protein [Candidatus Sulfotelmatobacter sp.]
MLNRSETPIHHKNETEMHKTPDGKVVESYANGRIRVYEGHSPKTTIDIPEHNTHVVIRKHGPFELNKSGEVEEIFVRKGHHKSKFTLAFADKINATGFEYDAWSEEGIIGSASGRRIDLLIASLFYDDSNMMELVKDTSMDQSVRRYLKFALITAGTHLHQV